jgi:hypothetical protein
VLVAREIVLQVAVRDIGQLTDFAPWPAARNVLTDPGDRTGSFRLWHGTGAGLRGNVRRIGGLRIQPLTDRGINGRGETVVLPALAEQKPSPPLVSNIRQDLAGFDALFRLPAPRLQVTATLAPGANPLLSYGEETLDVEMIHAIAPAAAIRVILFSPADLITAKASSRP